MTSAIASAFNDSAQAAKEQGGNAGERCRFALHQFIGRLDILAAAGNADAKAMQEAIENDLLGCE